MEHGLWWGEVQVVEVQGGAWLAFPSQQCGCVQPCQLRSKPAALLCTGPRWQVWPLFQHFSPPNFSPALLASSSSLTSVYPYSIHCLFPQLFKLPCSPPRQSFLHCPCLRGWVGQLVAAPRKEDDLGEHHHQEPVLLLLWALGHFVPQRSELTGKVSSGSLWQPLVGADVLLVNLLEGGELWDISVNTLQLG